MEDIFTDFCETFRPDSTSGDGRLKTDSKPYPVARGRRFCNPPSLRARVATDRAAQGASVHAAPSLLTANPPSSITNYPYLHLLPLAVVAAVAVAVASANQPTPTHSTLSVGPPAAPFASTPTAPPGFPPLRMRESNHTFPQQNRACVCITSALYDRRGECRVVASSYRSVGVAADERVDSVDREGDTPLMTRCRPRSHPGHALALGD